MPDPAQDCLFCRIVAGEVEAHRVFEDDVCVAFLDNRPLFPGHTLLVPREHHETLWDLPDKLVAPLFADAKRLSEAVRDAMGSQGAFVATARTGCVASSGRAANTSRRRRPSPRPTESARRWIDDPPG